MEEKEQEVIATDSEYHTASEFMPEFNSDHEPPTDKIAEERMVLKTPKIRIYKRILKIGKGMYMPAKYDKVRCRWKKVPEETINPRELDDIEWKTEQMGR